MEKNAIGKENLFILIFVLRSPVGRFAYLRSPGCASPAPKTNLPYT